MYIISLLCTGLNRDQSINPKVIINLPSHRYSSQPLSHRHVFLCLHRGWEWYWEPCTSEVVRAQRGGGKEAQTSGSGVRRDRARPELTTKEEDGSVVSRGPLRSAHLTFSPSLFSLFSGWIPLMYSVLAFSHSSIPFGPRSRSLELGWSRSVVECSSPRWILALDFVSSAQCWSFFLWISSCPLRRHCSVIVWLIDWLMCLVERIGFLMILFCFDFHLIRLPWFGFV